MSLIVEHPGLFTTLQDLGRPGYAHFGVTTSGAADRSAHGAANRAVGNPASAATLELTLGGLVASLDASAYAGRWMSLTGAPAPVTVDGEPVSARAFWLPAGSTLSIGTPPAGMRSYLAVDGGFSAPEVLGSVSWDSLARIGTPPLVAGQSVATGPPSQGSPVAAPARVHAVTPVVEFHWGPRHDVFSQHDLVLFATTRWRVSTETNRVGVRLEGAILDSRNGSLPSEGAVVGAIQVPPSGEPIVFLADHPVTGGYPIIGVVAEAHLWQLAQATPGTGVRFMPVAR